MSYLTLAVEILHFLYYWLSKNNIVASISSVTGTLSVSVYYAEVKAVFLLSLVTHWPLPSPRISSKTSDCSCSGFQHNAFALFALLFMANLSFVYSLASLYNMWRNAFLGACREASRIHMMDT